MCSPAEFWSTLLLVPLLGCFALNVALQHRFLTNLEAQRPELWRTLAQRRVITDDGNKSYAAAQWYLVTGEFRTLDEPELVSLGLKARLAFFALALAFVAWGAFGSALNAWPRLACLGVVQ